MEVTLTLHDDLATRLQPVADRLPHILELGLRELDAEVSRFGGLRDVLEVLARLPSAEEVMALRASPAHQARVEELLHKNRTAVLDAEERREWEQYEYVEHLVRMAKARAARKLAEHEN